MSKTRTHGSRLIPIGIQSERHTPIVICLHSHLCVTCMGLSYQRFPPFLAPPPPCSISLALEVSVKSRPVDWSRHTRHRHLSIISRASLFVDSKANETKPLTTEKTSARPSTRMENRHTFISFISLHFLWLKPYLS